jgi:hypothetical protein
MKYSISNKKRNSCVVNLIPESDIEKAVIKSKTEDFTYQYHYQQALYQLVHPNAELPTVTNDHMYPKTVFVTFQIAVGI